jgi:hypothetical protein
MHSPSFRVGVFLAITLIVCSCPALAANPKTGDTWQVTSQMSMEGMPMRMPAQTLQVCAPKNWQEPPGAQNPQQNCRTSDFKTVGQKTTWKMTCTDPDMTGEGEITRSGPDAYTGSIHMSSAQGSMTINLSGKRTGECDYKDTSMTPAQQAAANQKLDADLEKMLADGCKGVAQSLQLEILKLDTGGCNDAATKEIYCDTVYSTQGTQELIKRGDTMPGSGFKDAFEFCGNAKGKSSYCGQFDTPAGYELFASGGTGSGSPQATIASYCGLSAAQLEDERTKLCKAAAGNMTSLSYLAKFCPPEAKQLAEKECAGRNFTGQAASPYAQFCGMYAAQQAAQPTASAETPAEDTKKKTKKFFKSVWPH